MLDSAFSIIWMFDAALACRNDKPGTAIAQLAKERESAFCGTGTKDRLASSS